jgi:stage II sporulation protein D
VQCGHCNDSPWYNWKQDVPFSRVLQALGAQLQAIGALNSIVLDAPDPSGRSQFWTFTGAAGTQRVKAAGVRRALGTRMLPSLLVRDVSISQADQRVTIEGGGLGHGVGLCQWGARGMAQTGATARDIIAYYYPGTGIGND